MKLLNWDEKSLKEFQAQMPKLRANLLNAHFALHSTKIPVIIVISGADGAGKAKWSIA